MHVVQGAHRFVQRYGRAGVELELEGRRLALSLRDVRIGGEAVLEPAQLSDVDPRSPVAREVAYDRGPVRERYRLHDGNVEQTFTLDERLRGRPGDLTIAVGLRSSYAAAQIPGTPIVELREPDGALAFSYGGATAIDAGGRRRALTTALRGDALELRLDAAFLADAAWPVVVDPLVGSSYSITSTYQTRGSVEMSYAPGPNAWLFLTTTDEGPAGGDLQLNARTAEGQSLGSKSVGVAANDKQGGRIAASDGAACLVVWQERVGTGPWSVKAQRFLAQFPDFVADGPEWTLAAGAIRPDVGFIPDQAHWIVAWEQIVDATNHDLYAAGIPTVGAAGAPFAIVVSPTWEEKPTVTHGLPAPAGVAWVHRATAGAQGDLRACSADPAVPTTGPQGVLSADTADESDPDLGGSWPVFASWLRAAAGGDADAIARRTTFGPAAPVFGTEFALDTGVAHVGPPRGDASGARAVFSFARAPSWPPAPSALALRALTYDATSDPPVLIETLNPGHSSMEAFPAPVALRSSDATALVGWSSYDSWGTGIYALRLGINAGPTLSVQPTSISIARPVNNTGTYEYVGIANHGAGTLNWSASESESWFSLAGTTSGSLPAGGSAAFNVLTNSGLAPGTYTGVVTVTDPAALASPGTLTVTLTVFEVAWVSAPSGTFTGGQPIPMSWSLSAGSATVTHNDVQSSFNPYGFGDAVPNQPGSSGTYGAVALTPVVAAPATLRFRPHAYLGSYSHEGPEATVSVLPPTGPIVSPDPASLEFAPGPSGALPYSKTLTLSNPGVGTLNWTATPGAAWLKAGPTSGSRPAGSSQPLTVWVVPDGLGPGVHSTTLTFTAPGAANSPWSIPITYTVPSAAWVTPPAATYTAGDPIAVSWSVVGAPGTLNTQVMYDSQDADPFTSGNSFGYQNGPAGTYSATLAAPNVSMPTTYFFHPFASFSSTNVVGPVIRTVILPKPTIFLDRTVLSMAASAGSNPPDASLLIRNDGGGTLAWTVSSNAAWLGASPPSGALGIGASQTLTVSAAAAALPPGVYRADLTISAPGGSSKTVAVTLSVAAVAWVIPPAGTAVSGAPIPVSWSVDAGPLHSTSNRVHFSASPPVAAGPSGVDQPGPSGTYADTLVAPLVTAPTVYYYQAVAGVGGIGHSSPVVAVTVSPSGAPRIAFGAAERRFVAGTGGPNPAAQTVSLSNVANGTMGWTASDGAAWLSVGPTSGSLAAGASEDLTLTVDATGLPAGVHTTLLTVTAPGAANTPLSIPVTLTVVDLAWVVPPVPAVGGDPMTFSWSFDAGAAAATENRVGYTPDPAYFSWMTADQPGPSGTYSITMAAPNPAAVTTYWFRPQVTVDGATVTGPATSVLISPLTTPKLQISKTTMSFTTYEGQTSTFSDSLYVTNPGVGSLSFNVSSAETWVSESPSSGTVTGSSTYVGVTVNPAGLAAGVHTSDVVFSAPGVPNSPQTLTVTFTIQPRPANDNFADRIFIAGNGVGATGTSLGATSEAGEPGPPNYKSVWWTWTAPSSDTFTFDSSGMLYFQDLQVYTGAAVNALTRVDTAGPPSQRLVAATAGTPYHVRIGSGTGSVGPVQFHVGNAPRILVLETSFSRIMKTGGPNPAFPKTTIRNVGTGILAWTATSDQPWLIPMPAAGALDASEDQPLTLAIEAAGLPAGAHSAVVTLAAPGANNSPQTITVSLTHAALSWITPPPAAVASGQPIPVSWSAQIGGLTTPWHRVRYSSVNPPTGGQSPPDQSGGSGSYSASFTTSTSQPRLMYAIPEVYLDGFGYVHGPVASFMVNPAAGTLQVSSTPLLFAAPLGGPSPAARTFSFRRSTLGTMSWTASSDVPWLSINPPSGTAAAGSASFQVSVDVAGLSPGTYAGTLTVADPGSTNSPLAVPVTLVVASVGWAAAPSGSFPAGSPIPMTWVVSAGSTPSTHNSVHYGTSNPPGGAATTASQPGASGHYTESVLAPAVSALTTLYFQAHATIAGTTFDGPVASVTVTPATTPVLRASPEQLVFTVAEGGAVPPTQAFTLSNPGAGTLSWTASESVPWLAAAPLSGNIAAGASAPLTITVDPAGLPSGDRVGLITLTAPGALDSPKVVAVALRVIRGPILEATPVSVAFTGAVGTSAQVASVYLQNLGGGPSSWSVASNQPWLTLDFSTTGTLAPGYGTSIQYRVNPAGLAPGNHSGTLTFTDPSALNNPLLFPVSFTVWPAGPVLEVLETVRTVKMPAGATSWGLGSLGIRNAGSVNLSWAARDDAPWLTLSNPSGVLSPLNSTYMSLQLHPAGLAPGNHVATVVVEAPTAPNSPQTFTLTLVVEPVTPVIASSPASLAFKGAAGGAITAAQSVRIDNAGGGTLAWTASSGAPWLLLDRTSGLGGETIEVRADPAALAAGAPSTNLVITAAGASDSPLDVPVSFTVLAAGPIVELTPGTRAVFAEAGGPSPAPVTALLTNRGSGVLAWTAEGLADWLSVSPSSGSLPAGESQVLELRIDASGLAPGSYSGTAVVTAPGASDAPAATLVTLEVARVSWNGSPPATATSSQPIPLSWLYEGSASSWHRVEFGLEDPPNSSQIIGGTAGVNSSSFYAPYVAQPTLYYVRIRVDLSSGSVRTPLVPVLISPGPGVGALSAYPDSKAFYGQLDGPAPPTSSINVSHSGGSPQAWTASTNQPWLALSPTSGTLVPGFGLNLTLIPSTAGLAAGTHSATVTISAPGAAESPQTIDVSLTVFTISWTAPPPATATSGDRLSLSWQVNPPTVPVYSTRVTHGSTVPPSFSESGLEQPQGTFNAVVTVPILTTPVPYFFRPTLQLSGQDVFGPMAQILASPAAGPVLRLEPAELLFVGTAGGPDPAAQTVNLRNTGTQASMAWTAGGSQPWITVTPVAGTADYWYGVNVSVSVDTAGLAPGTHTGTLLVSAPSAVNSPQAVPVRVVLSAPPSAPPNDDFAARIAIAGSTVTTTGGNANATRETGEILTASPSSDQRTVWWSWTAPSTGTYSISTFGSSFNTALAVYTGNSLGTLVQVAANNDAGGTIQSQVVLSATAGVAYALQVNGVFGNTGSIRLAVSDGAVAMPTLPGPRFVIGVGAAAPPTQSLSFRNGGQGSLAWTASSPDAWITVGPASGTLAAGAAQALTIGVNPAGLPAGTHAGSVEIAGGSDGPVSVPVLFTVVSLTWLTPPPAVAAPGEVIGFSWNVEAGTEPVQTTEVWYSYQNPPWNGSASQAHWGSGGPKYGELDSWQYYWAPTLYLAPRVVLQSGMIVHGPVATTAFVTPSPLTVAPTSLAFAAEANGAAPASQSLTLDNPGGAGVYWTAVPSAPWLSVTPSEGDTAAGGSSPLTVSVQTAGLLPGVYPAVITIRSADVPGSPLAVPVTLTVGPDTTAATIVGLSSTTPDGAYGVGHGIAVTVTFSEAVTLAGGNLLVDLDSGAQLSIPPFGPASSVTVMYAVGAGDFSADLAASSPLVLGAGATLRDLGSLDAVLAIPPGQNLDDAHALVVDGLAPAVAITSPTNAATFATSAPAIALAGSASDAPGVAAVAWSNAANGQSGAATGSDAWSAVVPLEIGVNVITITATDAAGNAGIDTITVTRSADTEAPTGSVTGPTTYTTPTPPAAVSGTAADNVAVVAVTWLNTRTGVAGLATGLGNWSASIPLKRGLNSIKIFLWDAAGNVTVLELEVTYAPADVTAPTIAITAPAVLTTASTPAALAGTAGDDTGVVEVDWVNLATGVSGVATGTTSWAADVPLTAGPNPIRVRARDAAGNETTASITIACTPPSDAVEPTVDIVLPSVTPWAAPSSPLPISGTAADNVGIASVRWRNAATGGEGVAVGADAWSASIPLALGANVITVTARDPSGNESTDVLTATYAPSSGDAVPPYLEITLPLQSTFTVNAGPLPVTGLAADDQALTTVVWSNAETGETGAAAGVGAWDALIPLQPGMNTITLTAYDAAGNATSVVLRVTYASPSGGGGGGCGLLGAEAALLALLLGRRRRPRSPLRFHRAAE